MNKGYSNLNPTITVLGADYYSVSFDAARVAPLSAILVSGITDELFEAEINIDCRYGDERLFSFSREYNRRSPLAYDTDKMGRLLIRFSYEDFKINHSLLHSLTNAIFADVMVTFTVNGNSFELKKSITVYESDYFAGIDIHPEALASFVQPESNTVKDITKDCNPSGEYPSIDDAFKVAGSIVQKIRTMNIICVKRDSYSPEKKQQIISCDMHTGKSSVMATPIELAVLFCSCAHRLGYESLVVFVKNIMGVVSVFCGINVGSDYSLCLCESISRLKKALDDGEMLLFDPAVISSAQTIDVEHASFLGSEIMHKAGTDMILAVGVSKLLEKGVRSIYGDFTVKQPDKTDARTVLGDIYSGLANKKLFKLLSGDYSAFDVLPIIGFDDILFDKASADEMVIRPLEISEKISDFRDISDNFASFAFKDLKKKNYNSNELIVINNQYGEFLSRIKSKSHVVAGVYEKVFHDRISRMCYGTASGLSNYIISGFLRLTDKKGEETAYIPLCFTPVDIKCNYDYYLKIKKDRYIVNTALATMLKGDEKSIRSIDTIEAMFKYFEELSTVAKKSGDYADVTVIYEYALVKTDLSYGVMWNDIKNNGRKMLSNTNFATLLTEAVPEDENGDDDKKTVSFTLPRYMPEYMRKAVLSDKNIVLTGSGIKEKTDAVVNRIVYDISKGERVLVTSSREEFFKEIFVGLKEEELSELVLELDGEMTGKELYEIIKNRIEQLANTSINPSSEISTDYDKICQRIRDYSDAMSKQDELLGISVTDAILSYFSACNTTDRAELPSLKVKKEAFTDVTNKKFTGLFERAEALVASEAKALKSAGLPLSTPLKNHPLYPISSACTVTEESMADLFDMVAVINGVISDYREVFYDISEHICIDIADVKDLKGLLALNELFKLIISARELEIPDNISGKDITAFADGASKLKNDLGRAENIEYRLRFFNKEIFEDLDSVLSGHREGKAEQVGFIKKFLVKKNHKDVLLQYVSDENKQEFFKQDTEKIFELLEEYSIIQNSTAKTDSRLAGENSIMLAQMIKSTFSLLTDIYGDSADENYLNEKISKICRFVKLVASDTFLSKRLTYARAKLAQVYSENDCILSNLSAKLGADFSVLAFDSGILSYDGFGTYIKEFEKNLPAIGDWNEYLDAKKKADEYMPSFSNYLENYGRTENTDRIFASSLILPTVKYLIDKYEIIKLKKNYDGVKDRFVNQYDKARKLTSVNAVLSYRQRLKHFIETENLSEMEKDCDLPLTAFVAKYKKAVFTIFPVTFIHSLNVGCMTEGECVFSELVAGAFENAEDILLTCAAAAKRLFLVKYTENNGILSKKLLASGAVFTDVSYSLYSGDRAMGCINSVDGYIGFNPNPVRPVLITVNGTMRRVTDGANDAEAETCVSKASEIYGKTGRSVGIFTFTHGQAAFIKHLIDLVGESDKILYKGYNDGYIKVYEPNAPIFDTFDYAIVSIGAAVDKNGCIGWSFGCGDIDKAIPGINNAFRCASDGVLLVCSITLKEADKLRRTGYEAEKLYTTLFSTSKGILVSEAESGGACSSIERLCDIESSQFLRKLMLCDMANLAEPTGSAQCIAHGYDADEKKLYMYDCAGDIDVFDMLYFQGKLLKDGVAFEALSILDKILEKIDNAN